MVITFDDKKLLDLAENYKDSQKAMGERRAKLFHKCLGDLRNAESLEDVRHLPGRYHEHHSN